jgi:16S rRNA (guanine527-N7)-methyltransferase
VDTARIAQLLEPYLAQPEPSSASGAPVLDSQQLFKISTYVDILLRWNSRVNLTTVRKPEEIIRRHFGESMFAACHLFSNTHDQNAIQIIDVGSGAGFPGLPIKLWVPHAHVTLIESNHKKVAFLREVIRSITLMNINVFDGRAEDYRGPRGEAVTLRAVEKFESILPTAAGLVVKGGRLALLVGESQVQTAKSLEPFVGWSQPLRLPGSSSRVLLVGQMNTLLQESSQ